jgi:two-component system chemotaxis response regulator CheB
MKPSASIKNWEDSVTVADNKSLEAVVIGTSAGAYEALSCLLTDLPAKFPLPILIVVHVGDRDNSKFLSLLQQQCALTLCEAEDKVPIEPGTVYFAPPNYHLLVEPDKTLSLSADPPEMYSRPSIDALFESGTDCYGSGLIGIVLTGANSDGTKGLRSVIDAEGLGIVEDPEDAMHSEMPRSAQAANPSAQVMNINKIANYLRNLVEV